MALFKFSRATTQGQALEEPTKLQQATVPEQNAPTEYPGLSSILQSATSKQASGMESVMAPTKSLTRIKNTAPSPQLSATPTQIPQSKPGLTLFSDEKQIKDRMIADGLTDDEAENMIRERRKDLFGGDSKIAPKEAEMLKKMADDGIPAKEAVSMIQERRKDQDKQYSEAHPVKTAAKELFNVGAGAASLAAEQIGNVLDFAFPESGFAEDVAGVKEATSQMQDSTGFKFGRNVLGTGEMIATGPAKVAPTLGGRMFQGAAVGWIAWAAMPVLEKGSQATGQEIVKGGALGTALWAASVPVLEKAVIPAVVGTAKGVQALGQKAVKYGTAGAKGGLEGLGKSVSRDISKIQMPGKQALTRSIPESTIQNQLAFTPTERKAIERITGKTPANYVLAKGIADKPKEELAVIFDEQSINAYKAINDKLAKVTERVDSKGARDAISDMVEQLSSSDKFKRAFSGDIQYLEGLLKQDDFSALELNNVRRAFDKVNTGMFTAQGKMRSGLESNIDVKIRNAISSDIEKLAKKAGFSVKELNTELRAGIEMKDALLRSMSQEQRNNMIGLQDLGVMGVFSGGDPGTAIALGIAKRGLEGLRSPVAQKLFNLNKANVQPIVRRGVNIPTGNKSGIISRAPSVPPVPKQKVAPLQLSAPKPGTKQSANVINVKPITAWPKGSTTGEITERSKIVNPQTKDSTGNVLTRNSATNASVPKVSPKSALVQDNAQKGMTQSFKSKGGFLTTKPKSKPIGIKKRK